jgi:hypothetical protein
MNAPGKKHIQDKEIGRFTHELNITIGKGRIIWGDAGTDQFGTPFHEGWVLPGGQRTTDKEVARLMALTIDKMG